MAGAGPQLRLIQAPTELQPIAVPFLMVPAPTILLGAWNASMASVMRAHLQVRETLMVIVLMHLSHMPIGAGKLHRAHHLVRMALIAALSSHWLLSWFAQDPEILATGATLLWITVLLEPGALSTWS